MEQERTTAASARPEPGTVRELKDSVLLLVLAAASVGTYIAVGIVAVRVFAR
jgi:hypothetical protein